MAENNLRSSRSRDLSSRDPSSLDPVSRDPMARGNASRDSASDPLAELARLIGRSDAAGEPRHNLRENQAQPAETRASTEGANWRAGGRSAQEHSNQERFAQGRFAPERAAPERAAPERAAQERFAQERFAPERAVQERAPQGYNQERYNQERYDQERYNNQERYNRYAEQGEPADDHRYAVPPTAYPSAQADEPSHGDFADELPPPVRLSGGRGGHFSAARDASRGARFADEQTPLAADPRHGPPAFFGESESDHDEPNDEYGNEGDAYAADDAEEEYDEYYEDEEDNGYPRRSGTKVLTAVLGLAILATAGAFGYRTIFAGSALPSLPPVIKPADGPTKIKPSRDVQADAAKGSTVADDGADTRLVNHEEQPVDIPPPQDGSQDGPRVVSTVPVFPDPNSPSPSTSGTGFPPAQFPAQQPPASTVVASAAPSSKLASTPSAAPVAVPSSPTPKKIHTVSIRAPQAGGTAATSNAPLPLVPPTTRTHTASAAEPSAAETPPPRTGTASATESAPTDTAAAPGYDVQVTSQRSEGDAKTEFQSLQAKFPTQLGSRTPIIRRADLGAKGVYYRALVGPFASSEEAAGMCSNLKAAGGSCLVQKN
jgi:hypothetical protein